MRGNYSVSNSIRIFRDGQKAFGPGVARLLTLVDQTNSLRCAAAEMGMAYSKAWKILRETQAVLGFPLLITTIGGKNGGGAMLTPQAHDILSRYLAFELEAHTAAEAAFSHHFPDW